MSLNRAQLIGYLGADPEVRRMPNGKPVVNLSIATSESWKDRETGERRERTEWHRIVIFTEGLCGVAEKYLKKGSQVYIEAPIRTRKWTDQEGTDRYVTEIVMDGYSSKIQLLDRASGDGPGRPNSPSDGSGYRDQMDDDIPF